MRYVIFLQIISCQISSYRRDAVEVFAHLGRYTSEVGRGLPTFRDLLSLECGNCRLPRNVCIKSTRSVTSRKNSGLNNAQAYETVSKLLTDLLRCKPVAPFRSLSYHSCLVINFMSVGRPQSQPDVLEHIVRLISFFHFQLILRGAFLRVVSSLISLRIS